MDRSDSSGSSATWTAFLVMAFLVVGLVGLFASYAAPLPLQRAMARDAALDDALAAAHGPNPREAIEALRPRLGESADLLLPADGDPVGGNMDARITHARAAMRTQLTAEADEVATRTRWMICVITVMGAVFGAAVLRIGRRG